MWRYFVMKRIVFWGDSITDCIRNRSNLYDLGTGYAFLVSAALGKENPGEYEFINKGVSGDRIVDLYARMKVDFINLKPDYASIFIGVNDTWHEVNNNNGVETQKFEKIYTMMLEEIFEALPNLKIFLITPYVLKGAATQNSEDNPNREERFITDVAEKAEAVKRIAAKFNLPIIETQPLFDEAAKSAGNDYWAFDGVHPTPYGHALLKEEWIKTFNKIK